MDQEGIGKKIKQFRNKRNLTQSELAERINVSYQQIQKYERGKTRISVQRLISITEALDIPINSFFRNDNSLIISDKGDPYVINNRFQYELTKEEAEFMKLFRKITNKKIREGILKQLKGIIELESKK